MNHGETSTRDEEQAAGPPVEVVVNGGRRTIAAGMTVLALVDSLGLAGRPVAVEVDGQVVPRARFATCGLAGGERLEIVTFVGGG